MCRTIKIWWTENNQHKEENFTVAMNFIPSKRSLKRIIKQKYPNIEPKDVTWHNYLPQGI